MNWNHKLLEPISSLVQKNAGAHSKYALASKQISKMLEQVCNLVQKDSLPQKIMPSVRVNNEIKDQIFFITMTIKNWYYLFDRHERFQILEDSFLHCQQNKNLRIYSFVFMLNHLHFIGSAHDMGSILRDMKKYLSKSFKKNIQETEPSILKLFLNDGCYEFWQPTNFPKLIFSCDFFAQKLEYIHMNPVKKQYVHLPEDWRWSSASKVPTKIVLSELEL